MDNLVIPAYRFYAKKKASATLRHNKCLRRVYSDSYLSRDVARKKIYLDSFTDVGARAVTRCQDRHDGWYTDNIQNGVLEGVVLHFGRSGRQVYVAGTRHSDWCGVTMGVAIYVCEEDAARAADAMAKWEAEQSRREDAEFALASEIESLHKRIADTRRKCLALLRDMRPLRKGLREFPESVCGQLIDDVRRYRAEIVACRSTMEKLL